ncbi:MAG TPA: hypothetical protein VKH37_02255 [Ferruginibacter sp.]|nr:hypothetical protein [Ferruginibacter sp.]
MKKITTLLAFFTLVGATSFAQFGNHDYGRGDNGRGNDVVYNDGWKRDNGFGRDSYYFSERDKDMAIAAINNETDHQIMSVKRKFFMPRFKKEQLIYQLEDQRKDQIRAIYMKFNSPRNMFKNQRKHW